MTNGISPTTASTSPWAVRGSLLGDGTLRYGREDILECYYTAHLWRGMSAAAGLQFIDHPGYNQDRGPVVEMLRLHIDF